MVLALLAALGVPAPPARAAPAVVQTLGTASADSNGSGTPTLQITTGGAVTAQQHPGGGRGRKSIGGPGPGAATCSDSVNGTYTGEVGRTDNGETFTVCAKHNSGALPSGSTITINWSAGATPPFNLRAVAVELSGLAANPLDRTASAVGTGSTADSGTTATTSKASELLVGVIGNRDGTSFSAGTNGTANTCATSGTSTYTLAASSPPSSPGVFLEYCVVAATAAYKSTATLSGNPGWTASITTYKASLAPPVVATSPGALAYTESAGRQAIDSGLTVSDDSANLTGGTVSISATFAAAEDSLGFTNQNGITGSYNSGTGVLTLSGTASVATHQAALRSVTYTNSSHNPSTATRTVSFRVTNDTATPSNTATRQITLVPLAGHAKPAVFRAGDWLLRAAQSSGVADIAFTYGLPTDTAPLMATGTATARGRRASSAMATGSCATATRAARRI